MKKLISVMLVLSIIASLFAMYGVTASATSADSGLHYRITDNSVFITGCDETVTGELVIPSTISGKSVISISSFAFEGADITSVVIPDSIYSIGMSAFAGCVSLESVDLGNGVQTIGDLAFFGCNFSFITIPSSVVSIGTKAFGYKYAIKDESILVEKIEGFTIASTMQGKAKAAYNYALDNGFVFEEICAHGEEYIKDICIATCVQNGYTGDVLCKDCEVIISYGETVPATGHIDDDNDNICDVCDEAVSVQNPDNDNGDNDETQTGDISSFFKSIVEMFNKIIAWIKSFFGLA